MNVPRWCNLALLGGGSILLATQGSAVPAANHGKQLFELCSSCHGKQGQGNQKLAAPAIAGLPEWYLVAQLEKFRKGDRGLHPRDEPGNRMRPMAKTLRNHGDFDDVPLVAAYVASLPAATALSSVSTIGAGDAAKGKQLYGVCIACHGVQGEGMKQMNAPALTNLEDWYLFTQLKNYKNGLRGADASRDPQGALMVPMANTLGDEQAMRDVISYIKTLTPGSAKP